jgi:hypothetical protein
VSRVEFVIDGERVEVDLDDATLETIRRAVATGKRARQRQRERAIRGLLREHPGMSANRIVAMVGGRRVDVLRAILAVRAAGTGDGEGEAAAEPERPVP